MVAAVDEEENRRARDAAAVDHVTHARELYNQHSAALEGITPAQTALLLGRLIRGVDELNTRLAALEDYVTRSGGRVEPRD
jgi:hypothetical protein